MLSWPRLAGALVVLALAALLVVAARAGTERWRTAYVTGYASFERLTGCRDVDRNRDGQRDCVTASGELLDDGGFSAASNPRLGLPFGTRIEVLKWARGRLWRCRARVNDRTGSRFDFEFSYAMVLCTGGSGDRDNWDAPRYVSWRIVGGRR